MWIEARSSLHPIRSETSGLAGHLDLGPPQNGTVGCSSATGRLELALERLSSGNPLYDVEMRRRVDARRFPIVTGVLSALRPGSGADAYDAEGDVTFRGVERRVSDTLRIRIDGDTVVVEGEHRFDVRDFGLRPPRIMMVRVRPEVDVRVRIVATASS